MPELPEVETMVRGLRPQIEGRIVHDVEFCECSKKPIFLAPRSQLFRRKICGLTITRVYRLAKRVVVELRTEHDSICGADRASSQFLVIEPRMTGLMLVADPPTREHRRICWHLTPKRGFADAFEFWDRRGLGTVRLLDAPQMGLLEDTLGPDALLMDAQLWKQQLGQTTRPVKVAMLDQSLVAGVGNLYASEILHRAGVVPTRPARKISKAQWSRIADAAAHILNEAIRYEGSTLGDGTYRNALNKAGGYQNVHMVYQKADAQCATCRKGVIKRIVQAQRATFYCPACQRAT